MSTHGILLGIAGAVGAVLTLAGWYGRRVDDHSHCRRCAYDLHLKPSESARCPECGAALISPRSICKGHRERRTRALALGAVILLVIGGDVGFAGYRRAITNDWGPYKPLWWLERRVDSTSAKARDAALSELSRRAMKGFLPRDHESALVAKALAYQADEKRPWAAGWGDVVQAVHSCGRLSKSDWDRYELNAVQLTLEPVSRAVRSCDRVAFHLVYGPDRIGTTEPDDDDGFTAIIFSDRLVKIGSNVCPAEFEMDSRYWAFTPPPDSGDAFACCYVPGFSPTTMTEQTPVVVTGGWRSLDLGKHTVEMVLKLRGVRRDASPPTPMSVPERIVQLRCNLGIEDAPAIELDRKLEAAVNNAVQITDARVEYRNDAAWHEKVWSLAMTLESSGPPVDLAFGAVVTVPATTQDLGFDQKVFLPHGVRRQMSLRTGWYLEPHDLGGNEVRVTLYPDASNSPLGTTKVWGRPMTFEKITVRH